MRSQPSSPVAKLNRIQHNFDKNTPCSAPIEPPPTIVLPPPSKYFVTACNCGELERVQDVRGVDKFVTKGRTGVYGDEHTDGMANY